MGKLSGKSVTPFYLKSSMIKLTIGISDAAVLLDSLVGRVRDDKVRDVEPVSASVELQAADALVAKLPEVRAGFEVVQRILHRGRPSENLFKRTEK